MYIDSLGCDSSPSLFPLIVSVFIMLYRHMFPKIVSVHYIVRLSRDTNPSIVLFSTRISLLFPPFDTVIY